jgi:tetratricopeptide (TPR) repeat protein
MQSLGHLSRAAAWYARAVADTDEAVRLQAVPPYVDCLWRLGRDDVLGAVVSSLKRANWRRAGPLQAAALAVAATGRFTEAAGLVVEGRDSVREDERPLLAELEIGLWLRARRTESAMDRAREVCRDPAGEAGDTRCLAAANRLEGADLPALATGLVATRVASGGGEKALKADLAVRLLRAGDRAAAIDLARAITLAAPPDGMLLMRLGEAFRDFGLATTWADLLRHVPRAESNGSDTTIAAETARTLLSAGDLPGAAAAFDAFLATRRGGEAQAYLEWVRAGYRDRAEALLARANEDSIAEIDPRGLTEVAEDLARVGRESLLESLLERYRKGNEGIAAADETTGRVLATLGRFERAAVALSRVPARSLSDDGRAALMIALWRLGRRAESLSVALSGFDGEARKRPGSEDKPWSRAVLAFFLSEGAPAEAVSVLDRTLDGPEGSNNLRLLRARLRLQIGGDSMESARREFLEVLPGLDGPSDEAFRYVRDEVRAGLGGRLADDLANIRGVRAAEARYLAACLAGRRDRMEDARKALAGEDPVGSRALLAASRAAFECGRWDEAEPLSLRALKMLPRDADTADATRLALVSGRMQAHHPEKAVEEAIAGRTEDPAAVQAALAGLRFETGDEGGRARALFERSRWFLLDPSAALDAVDAALRAGDGALRREAEARALASTDDRPQTRRRLADLYGRALRDDLAAEVLAPLVRDLPGDDSMAGRRVVSLLRAGDGAGAAKAAEEYVARHGNRREAAAAVVSTAATDLTLDVVQAWIPMVIEGPPSPDASEALWQAARMAGRMGRMDQAESWARTSAALALDGLGLRVRAAQSVLTDPGVPATLLSAVVSTLGERAGREPPQAEKAVACSEAASAESARECARTLAPATASTGLLAAGDRALAAGRYDVARALYEASGAAPGASTALRRAIAARIVSTLGESAEAPPSARRSLGALALGWVDADSIPRDSDGSALQGHLSEMARGLPAGIEVYEREIALAPSEGSLHNNLAYLLSLAGGDLERAQREARTAVLLSPRGAPYYVETEAWARFLHEGPTAAIPLQERARRSWSLDQGGGLAEGFYHLGRMLEAAGRPAAAREAYRRAAVLDPADWSGQRSLRQWRKLGTAPAK